MKYKLIILATIFFVWIFILIGYYFVSASIKYSHFCVESREDDMLNIMNYYGFEGCHTNTLTYESAFIGLLLTVFAVQLLLILLDGKINFKRHLIYFCIGIFLIFFVAVLDQILLNSFQNIQTIVGGWILRRESNLFVYLNFYLESFQNMLLALLYISFSIILFAFGPFFSGLWFGCWRNKIHKMIGIPLFLILSFFTQFIIFLINYSLNHQYSIFELF